MLKLVWKSDLVIFQWAECISVFLLFPGDRFSRGQCAATVSSDDDELAGAGQPTLM